MVTIQSTALFMTIAWEIKVKGTVTLHSSFVGIDVHRDSLQEARERLSETLKEDFKIFENKKFERDGEKWHITVAVYSQYRKLTAEQKSILFGDFDFSITGIGEVEENGDKAWFATVESQGLSEMIEAVGLPARDLHITLAFSNKDIHNADKSSASQIVTF